MANAIYPKWKEAALQSSASTALSGTGATGVYALLIDTGVYTYSAANQFYSDLSGIVGAEIEIGATKAYTNGVFDGGDITFTAVSGNTAEAIILYVKNAGANTTWRLFAYLDTSITGLPVTPNGGDISVTWSGTGIVAL
jgi:hypothetical protein